jgi:hypothetical protein
MISRWSDESSACASSLEASDATSIASLVLPPGSGVLKLKLSDGEGRCAYWIPLCFARSSTVR